MCYSDCLGLQCSGIYDLERLMYMYIFMFLNSVFLFPSRLTTDCLRRQCVLSNSAIKTHISRLWKTWLTSYWFKYVCSGILFFITFSTDCLRRQCIFSLPAIIQYWSYKVHRNLYYISQSNCCKMGFICQGSQKCPDYCQTQPNIASHSQLKSKLWGSPSHYSRNIVISLTTIVQPSKFIPFYSK